MTNKPLVSVILTSYNQPDLLKKAFESLINQTYPNLEIIIADDCSTNSVNKQLIENWLLQYPQKVKAIFRQKNVGIPANKNGGLRLAEGEYITYLDGDDTYYENKIASEVETFGRYPEAGIVYSNFDIKNMNDEVISVWASSTPAEGCIFKNVLLYRFPDCHTHRYELFRRNVLYDLNFYNENLHTYEDLDLMIRYSLKYKVAYNDYVASSYYKNPASIVSNTKGLKLLEQQLAVYEKYEPEAKKYGFQKEFLNYINELKLNKLFHLDKLDFHLLLKALVKHPTQIFKIARITNYLIRKPKIKTVAQA